jgi:hypothetical protein
VIQVHKQKASVCIGHTPLRLNSANQVIGTRGVYFSTAEGDDIVGDVDADGDTVGGDGARSLMSDGGRARIS